MQPDSILQTSNDESQDANGKRKRLDEDVPPGGPLMKKVNGSFPPSAIQPVKVPNPLGERHNFRAMGQVESTFVGQPSSVPNPLADMHVET